MNWICDLGAFTRRWLCAVGWSVRFLSRSFVSVPRLRQFFDLLFQQVYALGVLSFVIIFFSACFIGMVVALQGFATLRKFSAEAQLGQLLALSIVRELGPVIGALLFAGRAGSSLTSEVGLMKATDQLSALEMLAVDPFRRIIFPRLWGCLIALPCLVMVFDAVAIGGGYLVGVSWLGVDSGAFWNNMQSSVFFGVDIANGFLKSLVFALIIGWISLYQGYSSIPNSLGISRATTKTVVYSSLLILALDFVLTNLMMGGW